MGCDLGSISLTHRFYELILPRISNRGVDTKGVVLFYQAMVDSNDRRMALIHKYEI